MWVLTVVGECRDKNVGAMYTFIDNTVYWNAAKKVGPVLVGLMAVGTYYFFLRK